MTEKQSAHIEQALAEIDRAQELGNAEAVRAAEKRLAAAGHVREIAPCEEAEGAAERPDATARTTPPKGRTTRQGANT